MFIAIRNIHKTTTGFTKRLIRIFIPFSGLIGVFALWACLEGPQGPPGESSTDTLYIGGDTLVILDTIIITGDTLVIRDTIFIDSTGGTDGNSFRLLGTNVQDGDSGEIARLRLRGEPAYSVIYFTARFNQIIDKSSTLECLTYSPLPVFFTRLFWPTASDIQIRFDMLKHISLDSTLLPQFIGMQFQVIFESCLSDIEGRALQNPDTISFVPEPYFRLVAYPGISYEPVNKDGRLFDHDSLILIPDSTVDGRIRLEFNSYLDSSVASRISWPTTDSIEIDVYLGPVIEMRVFNPDTLQPHDYTIFISPEMTDAYGHRIMHGHEIRFRVTP